MLCKLLKLIFISLLISAASYSQQLSGFENIPWRSSQETVRDSMSLIENIKLGYTKENVLGFSGGEFIISSFDCFYNVLLCVETLFANYQINLDIAWCNVQTKICEVIF